MSTPYILVNPQSPEHMLALVQFLKQTDCPFEVPVDYPIGSTNRDVLKGVLQDAMQSGLMNQQDVQPLFPDLVEHTQDTQTSSPVQHFKVPKDTKDFWGVEYLDKQGRITLENAQTRLVAYCKQMNLMLASRYGFATDELLRVVFNTDRTTIYFTELSFVLQEMVHKSL